MKNWFDNFEACLTGGKPSADLIGAGTASSDRAMAHYRFQHEAKVKEAIEETFPVLLRYMGSEWQSVWTTFREQNETSPRSLDWMPEVFLNFYQKTNAATWMKELARFEHVMDVHPWSHRSLSLKTELALTEDCRVILGNHEVLIFDAPVTLLYDEEKPETKDLKESVLIWQKGDGVYYRAMKEWEIEVLNNLSLGVEAALEFAPEDPALVGEFFRWLGSSHLIQEVRQG